MEKYHFMLGNKRTDNYRVSCMGGALGHGKVAKVHILLHQSEGAKASRTKDTGRHANRRIPRSYGGYKARQSLSRRQRGRDVQTDSWLTYVSH